MATSNDGDDCAIDENKLFFEKHPDFLDSKIVWVFFDKIRKQGINRKGFIIEIRRSTYGESFHPSYNYVLI